MIFDPIYFLFALPGLALALIAQFYLKSQYSRWSKVDAGSGLTGTDVANLLNEKERFKVSLQTVPGELSDHYDPSKEVVALSADNAINKSVANIAVVAHEFGHVQQKRDGYALFKVRTALVPAVQFGSSVGYFIMIIGFVLSASGLVNVGLVLFSLTAVFALVTLPIEIDASRRAMKLIEKYNLVTPHKLGGAKGVLTAAAMTYLAGLIQQLGTLAYFFLRSRD